MNTRALVYLGLASATLAGAYLYVQSLPTETVTAPATQGDAAQALESLSIIDGSLTTGSVAASDAFFPFPDALEIIAEAGATAVIQPGGSIRDDEVIAAADEAGLAMVLTGMRHFRH